MGAGPAPGAMNNLTSLTKKNAPAWSREFDTLVRAIGECKSKAEEDAIIAREIEALKPRLKEAKLDRRHLKELLVRMMYVEMLGHDASWGHVKALQACSESGLLTKKVAPPKKFPAVCHQRVARLWLVRSTARCELVWLEKTEVVVACRSPILRLACSWITRATFSSWWSTP